MGFLHRTTSQTVVKLKVLAQNKQGLKWLNANSRPGTRIGEKRRFLEMINHLEIELDNEGISHD